MPGGLSRLVNGARKHLGDNLNPEDGYLSYYDVRYLEREQLSSFPKASIVLLRPSMSFLLMNSQDPILLKEVLPNFTGTTHVFLPINDNTDVTQAEGGSHWSLLVVSVIDGVAFHYDSMSNANDREARSTTFKLEQLLGTHHPLRYLPMLDAPQQENGSDCGVFVCLVMKHLLLHRLLRADASRKITMSMRDAHIHPKDGRKLMLRIIEERKKEAERRRSRSLSPYRPKSAQSKTPPRIGAENDDLASH
ncbi:hypothetical protein ACEQ8H_000143 [Pleosporales sp. CAS-2024a]